MSQASQAPNETRLPRAVIRMSKAVEDRLKANGLELPNGPSSDPTPPAPPAADAATPPAPTPSTPPAKPVDPRHSDPAYWEQRFRVMHGKLMQERDLHKAEIDGLEARIADLETAVSAKEQELSELKSRPSPSSSKIDLGQFLTPEEIERIGEDEAATIVTAAQKAVELAVARLTPAPAPAAPAAAPAARNDRATRDAERQARTAKQQFFDELLDLVPDYQTIDVSQAWHTWLAEPKGPRGVQRQAVLEAHMRVGDARAVADMFEAFRKETAPPPAPVAPHGDGGQNEDPAPPAGAGALKPPTEKEIRDFYTRSGIGKVSPTERAQFEARLKLRAAARQ